MKWCEHSLICTTALLGIFSLYCNKGGRRFFQRMRTFKKGHSRTLCIRKYDALDSGALFIMVATFNLPVLYTIDYFVVHC